MVNVKSEIITSQVTKILFSSPDSKPHVFDRAWIPLIKWINNATPDWRKEIWKYLVAHLEKSCSCRAEQPYACSFTDTGFFKSKGKERTGVGCVSPWFLTVTEAEAAEADAGWQWQHIACWTVMIQFRHSPCSPHYLLLPLLPAEGGGGRAGIIKYNSTNYGVV